MTSQQRCTGTPENMNQFYLKKGVSNHREKPFGWSYRKLLRIVFIAICVVNTVSLLIHIDLPSASKSSSSSPLSAPPTKDPLCITTPSTTSSSKTNHKLPAKTLYQKILHKKTQINFEQRLQKDAANMARITSTDDSPYAYPKTNIQAYSIASLLQTIGFALNVLIRLRGLLAIGVFKGWDDPPKVSPHIVYSDRRESFSGCIFFLGGMIILLGANGIGLFKVTLFDLLCHCVLACLGVAFLAFSIDDNRSTTKNLSSVPWRSTPDLSSCSLPTLPADDDLHTQNQHNVALNMWS